MKNYSIPGTRYFVAVRSTVSCSTLSCCPVNHLLVLCLNIWVPAWCAVIRVQNVLVICFAGCASGVDLVVLSVVGPACA